MNAYFTSENGSKAEDYLGGKIYCREERQFAALLYHLFLEKRKKGKLNEEAEEIIRKCLGIPESDIIIEDVYFEATLMRDFFEKDEGRKEDFNRKLLRFCMANDDELKKSVDEWVWLKTDKKGAQEENLGQGEPYNLGQWGAKRKIRDKIKEKYSGIPEMSLREYINEKKSISESMKEAIREKARFDIAGMMMNATPDILVVYKKDEKKYVKAIECKYESDEGPYDIAGINGRMQFFIEECIMLFLFGDRSPSIQDELVPEKNKWKDVNSHYPKCPQGGMWVNEEFQEIWKEIFIKVYEDILEQKISPAAITNAGLKVIQFAPSPTGKEQKWTEIQIEELLKLSYCRFQEKQEEQDRKNETANEV